ncbi:hypothetical protein CAAN1_03S05864 [[Candida] anglica]|uniref:Zn(2)-C6 fungal-type domain-containing protein n=1 Tax=[Candida] anglica TaxID=148631 RepID=A0ABP0ELI0_9ASCO
MLGPEYPHKRRRVLAACISCRSKKIKCDGQDPCHTCQQSRKSCKYDTKSRKQRSEKTPKRLTNSESIQSLNIRLGRMEVLLEAIAANIKSPVDSRSFSVSSSGTAIGDDEADDYHSDGNSGIGEESDAQESKMDENGDMHEGVEVQTIDKKPIGQNLSECSPSEMNFTKLISNSTSVDSTEGVSGTSTSLASSGTPKVDTKDVGMSNDSNADKSMDAGQGRIKEYFGSHSLFCIFSDSSIRYVKLKLPPKDVQYLTPIRNIPKVFEHCMVEFTKNWVDPKIPTTIEMRQLAEGTFPERQVVWDLLDHAYVLSYPAIHLCETEQIKDLFDVYYSSERKRRMTNSELLIMNLALTLSVTELIDIESGQVGMRRGINLPQSLCRLSQNDLFTLYSKLFSSCAHYYARISTFSEGIRTIQAILLFVILINTSWIISEINYVLISLAVRFAQDLGLHRFESYGNDSPEIGALKRKIWWFCQYLDMDVCYKSGKPPLVNVDDVSTLTERDTHCSFTHDILRFTMEINENPPDKPIKPYNIFCLRGYYEYHAYFLLGISRIRSKSYALLFSANSKFHTPKSLSDTVRKLTSELFHLSLQMDPRVRPRLFDDQEFSISVYEDLFVGYGNEGEITVSKPENFLDVHFAFLLHIMTINRIPYMVEVQHKATDTVEGSLEFRNLALNSARTILIICTKLDKHTTPRSFVRGILFYPLTAFLVVLGNCINQSNSADTLSDIKLLSDASMKFFSYHKLDKLSSRSMNHRETVVDLVTRVMFHILIKIVESQSSNAILAHDPALKEHLEEVGKVHPDLFIGDSDKGDGNVVYDQVNFRDQKSSDFIDGPTRYAGTQFSHNEDFQFVDQNIISKPLQIDQLHDQPNSAILPHTYKVGPTMPTLSNIVNHNSQFPPQNQFPVVANSQIPSEFSGEDIFGSMMYNMPNFFHDNNLGSQD